VPGFRQPERSLLSRRDQRTALLVFLVLGLVEEVTVSQGGWLNERIVAVCAAGLVAGPWVGLAVSMFVAWLAVAHDGLPLDSIAISMLCGGLAGGSLYRWRAKLAQHPLTGFCLTFAISLLRNGLIFFHASGSRAALPRLEDFGMGPKTSPWPPSMLLTAEQGRPLAQAR
jgi:LytS/YehU family sensor histidine kinase